MKILVVDDEEMIREVIKEYSINEGFLVEEADNGRDAVCKVKNNDYIVLKRQGNKLRKDEERGDIIIKIRIYGDKSKRKGKKLYE